MKIAYREDLAYIHHVGHGALAKAAAGRLIEELNAAGLSDGTVVDLGSGSGILAGHLSEAGYLVMGIDVSEAMVAIARERVPTAEFQVGSFLSAKLPACVAVAAIGEVLNYTFDERNNARARADLFSRIFKSLVTNGLFMFDVAGLDRADGSHRTFTEGKDWAVLVQTESDMTSRVLTRKITSFRRMGTMFRRDTENHRLVLTDPIEILRSLRTAGFQAETLAGYDDQPLPPGITGLLARRRKL